MKIKQAPLWKCVTLAHMAEFVIPNLVPDRNLMEAVGDFSLPLDLCSLISCLSGVRLTHDSHWQK